MDDQDKLKPATASSEKNKWDLKKKIWVIGGAVIAIIIALVIIVNTATSAPVKISNQLVSDIQAKNATGAYSLLSSEAQKVVPPVDQFNQTVDQIGPILSGTPKMISKEVSGQTGSAATAKVVYEIKGSDGATYVITVNLTKENGQWKVLNFDSSKK